MPGDRAGDARGGPQLVLMAAGLGRRFGGPKQLEPVGPSGERLPEYAIFDAARHGFSGVVLVVREEIEDAIRDLVRAGAAGSIEVSFVRQRTDDLPGGCMANLRRGRPWGTGHALWSCRGAVDRPFAVLNADDLYGEPVVRALARFLWSRTRAGQFCAMAYRLADTLGSTAAVNRALCTVSSDGRLAGLRETGGIRATPDGIRGLDDRGDEVPLAADRVVSMNAWGFTPDLFDHLDAALREFLERHGEDGEAELGLPDVIDELVRDGTATVDLLPTEARWVGLTGRDDLVRVRAEIARRVAAGDYPDPLWGRAGDD